MPEQARSAGDVSRGLKRLLLPTFVLLALAILVAGVLSTYRSTRQLIATSAEATNSLATVAAVDAVRDALLDVETGSRGFVISGDSTYLDPYRRGVIAAWLAMDSLERILRLAPEHSAHLSSLRSLVASRVARSDTLAALRQSAGFESAQEFVASGRGKATMDSVRAVLTGIETHERSLHTARRSAADEAARVASSRAAFEGVAAALVLTAGLVLLLRDRRREADRQLRLALDGLLEGCQIIDREFRYVYVNPAAAAHGRTTVNRLLGRKMTEAYPGIEATQTYTHLRQVLETGEPCQWENKFTFPDGSEGWFALSVQAVPEGIFVLSVDITQRVRGAEALRRSEARHRALLAGLPNLVFLLESDGTLVDLHAPDRTQVPVTFELHEGQSIASALPGEVGPQVIAAVREVAETGRAVTMEYALELTTGTRWFEAAVVPASDGRITIVARDITARHLLEGQLRQSQKMEAIGQLTGGIAHDFNNILTIIGANAELIESGPMADETAREGVREIAKATQRGAVMIGQLLRFSRRGMLTRRPADPGVVVAEFASMLRRLVPESVRLEVAEAPVGQLVQLDAGAIEQIVANLCTNARDAMPDGGTLRISCELTELDAGYHASHPWVRPGEYVCISVTDTGHGMDEATRQRIFEPFFTTKPVGVGTGLGLAMVYGLMKDHAGMVHAYSEPGRGTEVKLYFPVSDQSEPEAVDAGRAQVRGIRGGGETLLIVEDDAAIRRASRRALEAKGYVVLEAGDGEEALDVMRRRRETIALIISDLVMPNLGGRQLAEALRADGVQVPILLTSGYSESTAYRDGELVAGVTFLHKPWTLTDLYTRVRELLDGAPPSG